MNLGYAIRGKSKPRVAMTGKEWDGDTQPFKNGIDMLMPANENQHAIVPPAALKVRHNEEHQPTCCNLCTGNVGLITAERAAMLCQCSRRKIYHWIEEGHLHFVELTDGAVLVCGRTLAKKIEELNSSTDKLSAN